MITAQSFVLSIAINYLLLIDQLFLLEHFDVNFDVRVCDCVHCLQVVTWTIQQEIHGSIDHFVDPVLHLVEHIITTLYWDYVEETVHAVSLLHPTEGLVELLFQWKCANRAWFFLAGPVFDAGLAKSVSARQHHLLLFEEANRALLIIIQIVVLIN